MFVQAMFVPVGPTRTVIPFPVYDSALMRECYVFLKQDKEYFLKIVSARTVSLCTTLCLRNCGFKDDDVCMLSRAIQGNKTIVSIDISDNTVSVRGIEYLTKALTTCNVYMLNVSANHIKTAGFILLCNLMTINPAILSLYVVCCLLDMHAIPHAIPHIKKIIGLTCNSEIYKQYTIHKKTLPDDVILSTIFDESQIECNKKVKTDEFISLTYNWIDSTPEKTIYSAFFHMHDSIDMSQLSASNSKYKNVKKLSFNDCNIKSIN